MEENEHIFNKWCWSNWMSVCRRLQIDPYLSPCTKLKSKWIKYLNIKPETLNLIEEKVENNLECTRDNFLNVATAQALRSRINKCDLMKLKVYVRQQRISVAQSRKHFYQLYIQQRTNIPNKEFEKLDNKKPDNPTLKWLQT